MKKTSSYSSQSCDHVKLHNTISSQRHHRNTANASTTTLQTPHWRGCVQPSSRRCGVDLNIGGGKAFSSKTPRIESSTSKLPQHVASVSICHSASNTPTKWTNYAIPNSCATV